MCSARCIQYIAQVLYIPSNKHSAQSPVHIALRNHSVPFKPIQMQSLPVYMIVAFQSSAGFEGKLPARGLLAPSFLLRALAALLALRPAPEETLLAHVFCNRAALLQAHLDLCLPHAFLPVAGMLWSA